MKERHAFLQEIKILQKQLLDELHPTANHSLVPHPHGNGTSNLPPQHAELNRHLRELSRRWQLVFRNVKQQHTQLSSALSAAAMRALSPLGPLSPVSLSSSRGSSSTRSSPSVCGSNPSSPPPQAGSKQHSMPPKCKSFGMCSSDSLDDLVESLKQEANRLSKKKLTSPPDPMVNGWRNQIGDGEQEEVPPSLPPKKRPSPLPSPGRGAPDVPMKTSPSQTYSFSPPPSPHRPPPPPPPPPPLPPSSSLAVKLEEEKMRVKKMEEVVMGGKHLPLHTPGLQLHLGELQVLTKVHLLSICTSV